MKRLALLAAFIITPALAQQPQPSDPGLTACQQLLGNANAQTIQMAVQAQTLDKQLQDARAELAKLKEQAPKQ